MLRVFFDHGHEWPLWEAGTWKYAMEPVDYGFSPQLTELMRRWYERWHPIADFDVGQPVAEPAVEDREAEARLRRQVVAAVEREVPAHVMVET